MIEQGLLANALAAGIALATLLLAALASRWRASAAWTIAAVGALLVAGCFVGEGAPRREATISGSLSGDARVPIEDADARTLHVEGGEGRLEGDELVLACPEGCSFRLSGRILAGFDGAVDLELRGGPLSWSERESACRPPAWTVRLVEDCVTTACAGASMLVERADGPHRARLGGHYVC